MKKVKLAVFSVLSLIVQNLFAQGDGPRAFLLAPKGVTGINAKWINLNQNLIPAGTVLIPGAEIKVDVFPITLFHTFSLGGRFAQAFFSAIPGKATATAKIGPPIGPLPVNQISANGFSDGMFGLRVGITGAPALSIVEFAKRPMQFSLFGEMRIWYSGTYESSKLFNMGTNRLAFQFSAPMAIPLNKNRSRATWLEVSPALMFFTDNKDPARSSRAEQVEQAPLLVIENHLTHNFTAKFWASVNMRIQSGGRTTVDGVQDDNNISVLGGGAGIGYQVLPPLGLSADYGGVLISDQTKGKMFRVSMVFTYVNLKKWQPAVKPS